MNMRQIAALAGMIGPVLFVAIFTLEGFLRPGYDPLRMYISALSLGPRGWIQITNFIAFGVFFLIFTHGIAAEFQNGRASKAGPILLTIIGISFLVSGPFVMDPATNEGTMSLCGMIHGIFGGIVFTLMPLSCFVFLRRFQEDQKWRSFQWCTIVAGIIVTVAVILLSIVTKLPAALDAYGAWVGLIQRMALVPYMIWIFAFALKFYKKMRPL